MPFEQYRKYQTYEPRLGVRVTTDHYKDWRHSPRENGKLKLQSNVFYYVHRNQERFYYVPGFEFAGVVYDASHELLSLNDPVFTPIINNALARFTGKVRKHNANLGVTLGSAKQSIGMIADRSTKIASMLDFSLKEFKADRRSLPKKRRDYLKARAGDVLEGEFGWIPLVQDIQSAFGALGRSPPDGWVSARAKGQYKAQLVQAGEGWSCDRIATTSGSLQATVGGSVRITSENLFLLNRLGLLNLPGVAWDLIPWSFVVNIFTNMGQMVNSLSDFVGVDITNASLTRSSFITREDVCVTGILPSQYKTSGMSESIVTERSKGRDVGLPTPKFMVKVPELNAELAVIAISLLLQKMSALNKLLKF